MEILKFILNFLFYTSIISCQLSTNALIAYQSLIVSHQLKNISHNFSQKNLQNIYHFVCKTNSFIKDLDQLFSSFISISIYSFAVISIAFMSILERCKAHLSVLNCKLCFNCRKSYNYNNFMSIV